VGEYVLESGGVRGMEFLKDECATISWLENMLLEGNVIDEQVHWSVEKWNTFCSIAICFPQAAEERFPWSTPSPLKLSVHTTVGFQFHHLPSEPVHIATCYPRCIVLI
jgi:hypothetical protein